MWLSVDPLKLGSRSAPPLFRGVISTSLEFYCLPIIQIKNPSKDHKYVADIGIGLGIDQRRFSCGIQRSNLNGRVVRIVNIRLLNSGYNFQGLQGVDGLQSAAGIQ